MATTTNGIKLIYGAGGLSPAFVVPPAGVDFHDHTKEVLDILEKEDISTLDTAEIYAGSEEEIGYHDATSSFIVDTKLPGGFGEPRRKEQIIAGGKASLERLKTKQVDVLYFHAPDTTVPFEEQLSAANELYKQGVFKQLGISNFTAAQTQEVYEISKKNGWILPTVYQGNYSAFARVSEDALFPALRKLGISFYAYSPIAGGFLAKTRQQVERGEGRFDPSNALGQLYGALYNKGSLLNALDKWNDISRSAGVSKAELAYRWVAYHSILSGEKGDGIIFGAKLGHLRETIGYLRAGPLPAEIAERVDALWQDIKHEAPRDNFHGARGDK